MSSSVPIPPRQAAGASSASSSAASSYSSSFGSPVPSSSSSKKGKAAVSIPSPASSVQERISPRRPSLMGASLSQSEHTVINLAHSSGPPRLVTCVKSSQGFDWNQELFLPSYAEYDAHDLEHKPDPVQEIILTDDEAADMLPQ